MCVYVWLCVCVFVCVCVYVCVCVGGGIVKGRSVSVAILFGGGTIWR